MNHLDEEALLAGAEGTASREASAHLDQCAQCSHAVAELRAALDVLAGDRAQADPGRIYWDRFPRELRRAIDRPESPPLTRPRAWLPYAAAVLLGIGGAYAMYGWSVKPAADHSAPPVAVAEQPAESGEPDRDIDTDEERALMREMAGDLDLDSAIEGGIMPMPGGIDRAALGLSDAERAVLVRLIEEELKRTES